MVNSYPTKKLGEVCEIVKGKKPELYKQKGQGMLPYLGARFMRGSKEAEYASIKDKNSVAVSKNDLIIICDGSKSGDMFSGFEGILSSTMGKIKFSDKEIEPKYLKSFLDLNFSLFNNAKKGAAIPHLDFNIFKNLQIPLPPVGEQRKIVAKLEKVLGKIKEAKKLREEAESAAALLPAELHRIFSKPTTPQNKHPYKLENVRMLPEWEEKELGEVAELKTIKNTKTGLPFVGMEDVESTTGKFLGSLEPRSVKSTTFHFDNNSVLYGKLRPYLNKVLLPDFEGHCSTEFIPIKPRQGVSRKWLAYWLKSPQIVDRAMSTNTGSRMPRANIKDLIKFKISLPPIAEQKRIVARLDALSAKITSLRQAQSQTTSNFTALEQSVLHQAFTNPI